MKNRLAPLTLVFGGIAASLASCSYFKEQERAVQMMAPTPLPVYAVGDTYVFDDDGRTVAETVASITLDGTHWTSDSGVYWTSYANPFLQPKEYAAHSGALKIQRAHSKAANEFFPLMVGKRVRYSVTERTLGNDAVDTHMDECEVISQRNVNVRAGAFDTYEVACETKDGVKTFYYAPEVRHNVMTVSGTFFNKKTKELISYNKSAPSRESSKTKGILLKRSDLKRRIFKTKSKRRDAAPNQRTMYGVQLGAYLSHAGAKAAWERFALENPERLGNVNARYQEYLPPDGRARVTRLIVGEFRRFTDAKIFCYRLKESGLDCWSVKLN